MVSHGMGGETSGADGGTGRDDLRVIHVERDEGIASLVETYLTRGRSGVSVRRVRSPDGVASAVDERVDCVVTDHRPPGTDAVDVAEAVRTVAPEVPVVVFSCTAEAVRDAGSVHDAVAKRAGLEGLDELVERVGDAVARGRVDAD
ncbi:hypothetical protein Hbl1158_05045 [Halobaculum sp. CBA1158]|uniref:hypothetical protein n=1 Tax=Halobaculum sp. CBA1158 TaxID=2904243 RepID=UPI001F29A732|nr:hypothetical protein [Halobaculum sp. CBA1158]UIP00726.1 hypothetical protein Hbl1158_05045 [Halobaculum sp. CBA1158]